MNLFENLKSNEISERFHWLNEPSQWTFKENHLMIQAPAQSDFFHDGEGPQLIATAPYLYTNVIGDLVGIVAQCPAGKSCDVYFEFLDLQEVKIQSAKFVQHDITTHSKGVNL